MKKTLFLLTVLGFVFSSNLPATEIEELTATNASSSSISFLGNSENMPLFLSVSRQNPSDPFHLDETLTHQSSEVQAFKQKTNFNNNNLTIWMYFPVTGENPATIIVNENVHNHLKGKVANPYFGPRVHKCFGFFQKCTRPLQYLTYMKSKNRRNAVTNVIPMFVYKFSDNKNLWPENLKKLFEDLVEYQVIPEAYLQEIVSQSKKEYPEEQTWEEKFDASKKRNQVVSAVKSPNSPKVD